MRFNVASISSSLQVKFSKIRQDYSLLNQFEHCSPKGFNFSTRYRCRPHQKNFVSICIENHKENPIEKSINQNWNKAEEEPTTTTKKIGKKFMDENLIPSALAISRSDSELVSFEIRFPLKLIRSKMQFQLLTCLLLHHCWGTAFIASVLIEIKKRCSNHNASNHDQYSAESITSLHSNGIDSLLLFHL